MLVFNKRNIFISVLFIIFILCLSLGYTEKFKIATVKYNGGGDWYNDPTSIPNMLNELHLRTGIEVDPIRYTVSLTDDELFKYPFIFLTGHGNIVFSNDEIKNLRKYLMSGGFLYIDDDFGLNKYIRREMKKVFPNKKWKELPFSHPIYHSFYDFPKGLPKIHKHNNKPPQGFALMNGKRVMVFYTYESNPADGWADANVHNDPPKKREAAFKIGVNIIMYMLNP